MTTVQENKRSMFDVTQEFLLQNATITALLPNYADYFTVLTGGITEIDTIRKVQELDKRGLAMLKAQLKDKLLDLALEVSRKAVAYAGHTDDLELLNEINYSESDLKKSPDTILKDKCQIICDRASDYAVALLPYEVTPALLAALQSAITAYNASMPKPRLGIADRKQATRHLADRFRKIDKALDKIDILVEVVRKSHSEFYEAYQTVRTIVDNGHGKLSLRGRVIDSESGSGLHGATLTFSKTGGNGGSDPDFKELIKKTAKKGGFFIKKIPQGSYKVHIGIPGYEEKTVTVHVTEGTMSTFETALKEC